MLYGLNLLKGKRVESVTGHICIRLGQYYKKAQTGEKEPHKFVLFEKKFRFLQVCFQVELFDQCVFDLWYLRQFPIWSRNGLNHARNKFSGFRGKWTNRPLSNTLLGGCDIRKCGAPTHAHRFAAHRCTSNNSKSAAFGGSHSRCEAKKKDTLRQPSLLQVWLIRTSSYIGY